MKISVITNSYMGIHRLLKNVPQSETKYKIKKKVIATIADARQAAYLQFLPENFQFILESEKWDLLFKDRL